MSIKLKKGSYKPHEIMTKIGWIMTNGEGRRHCHNGAFKFDGFRILNPNINILITDSHDVKLGKRFSTKIFAE